MSENLKGRNENTNLIVCIFCLNSKESSDEHVMPKTLGGNLILKDVCVDCNNSLSNLDQSLADNSLLILPRLVQQPDAIWGKSAKISTGEIEQEVRLGHQFSPEMKAQLIFTKGDKDNFQIRGSGSDINIYKIFFKVLKKQISKNGIENIPILSSVDSETSGFRLVLNRSNQVIFRPSNQNPEMQKEEFRAMAELLKNKFTEIEKLVLHTANSTPVSTVDHPELMLNLTLEFNLNLRAVAKIAYTFLAKTYGPRFVQNSKFQNLRDYIIHGLGADQPGAIWWNGDEIDRSLGSSRYAKWMNDFNKQPMSLGTPDTHVISIFEQKDRHIVFIEFYGEVTFSVDVGQLNIPLQLPYVHEFNFVKKHNSVLSPEIILNRLMTKISNT